MPRKLQHIKEEKESNDEESISFIMRKLVKFCIKTNPSSKIKRRITQNPPKTTKATSQQRKVYTPIMNMDHWSSHQRFPKKKQRFNDKKKAMITFYSNSNSFDESTV